MKMKIVILGGRNHWISFKLLSVFFSVVDLAPSKHKEGKYLLLHIANKTS